MKSLSLAILLSLFAALASGQTVSIQGSGALANLTVNAQGAQIILRAASGVDANGKGTALLGFDVITSNPDGTITDKAGFGLIPTSAFTPQKDNGMNLSVDTSQVSGFNNLICTTTPSPNGVTTTCSPGLGGPVQVVWTANGIFSAATNMHDGITTGPFTQHFVDEGSSNSANTQGSVLGTAFSDTGSGLNSFFGSDHTHNITISKN